MADPLSVALVGAAASVLGSLALVAVAAIQSRRSKDTDDPAEEPVVTVLAKQLIAVGEQHERELTDLRARHAYEISLRDAEVAHWRGRAERAEGPS